MAKKKVVHIDVVVDDKGTTKKIAVDAKALGTQLDRTAKSSKSAERQTKGLGQQSSNSTKNFSKMSQGISGGLVPAYATLAAQIFAVSAAFQFLQSASDYKNLIKSQETYGALTGTNFTSITKSLQAATAGQLKYQEAASATAIGSAAGLSAEQLEKLATAALNSSVALGRNLTDSFNRLIRGTTKAEPELLDELGIILRLKPATEEYARSIGVAADSLNAFQRTQAVTNFVLTESENKFGRLSEIMDEDSFAVAQFTKSFDDLVNSIKVGTISGITPALKFFTENTNALVAALGLFALPITKGILPSLDDWAKKSKKTARAANIAYISSKKELIKQREEVERLSDTQESALKKANKLAGKSLTASDFSNTKQGGNTALDFLSGKSDSKRAQLNTKRVLDAAAKNYDDFGIVTTGKLKGYNRQQVQDLTKSFELRTRVVQEQMAKQVTIMQKFGANTDLIGKKVTAVWKGSFAKIKSFGTLAVRGIDGAFKLASFIGIGVLLFELGQQAFNFFTNTKKVADKASKALELTNERLKETAEFLVKIRQTRAEGLVDLAQAAVQTGNALGTVNLSLFIKEIEQLRTLNKTSKSFKDLEENLQKTGKALSEINPGFNSLVKQISGSGPIKGKKAFLKLDSVIRGYGVAIAGAAQSQKDFNAALSAVTGNIKVGPFDSLIKQAKLYAKNSSDALAGLKAERDSEKQLSDTRLSKLMRELEIRKKQKALLKDATQRRRNDNAAQIVDVVDRIRLEKKSAKDRQQGDKETIEAARVRANISTRFLIEMEYRSATIKKSDDSILKNRADIAEMDKLDLSFANQKKLATVGVLQANIKVAEATKNLATAESFRVAVLEEHKNELHESVILARQQEDAARETLRIAKLDLTNEQAATAEKQNQIDLAKRLNTIALTRLGVLKETAAAELNVQRIKSGLGTGAGLGTASQARDERSARELVSELKIKDILIQKAALEEKIAFEEKKKEKANQDTITTNQKLIDQLNIQLAKQKLSLEILEKTEERLMNGLRSRTVDLQQKAQSFSFVMQEQRVLDEINRQKGASGTLDATAIENIRRQIKEQDKYNTLIDMQTRLRDGLTNSLTEGLDGLVTGTLSVKQAFSNMGMSVLKIISRIITEMLVARMIMAAFGGGLGTKTAPTQGLTDSVSADLGGKIATSNASTFKLPGSRHGGIMKGYSEGGIARGRNAGYPAILHGTEAVVPLPNGNSIPVEMRNGGGGTNNVGITINIDNNNNAQSEQTGGSGNQAAAIGKLVAGVVQDELQKQKRPGGILSPYGAA